MTELKLPKKPVANWEQIRDEWVRAVEQLVADVESWCRANDWPIRRIEKRIEDNKIGDYDVPALVIQVDLVKLMLEPVARFVPGAQGVVDLYLMPQYDDAASIYLRSGLWYARYHVVGQNVPQEFRNEDPQIVAMTMDDRFDSGVFAKIVSLMI